MNLCKLVERAEYLLFALVLLPTFLVIGAAIVSLANVARAMESEVATLRTDEDCSGLATKEATLGYRPPTACLFNLPQLRPGTATNRFPPPTPHCGADRLRSVYAAG